MLRVEAVPSSNGETNSEDLQGDGRNVALNNGLGAQLEKEYYNRNVWKTDPSGGGCHILQL